MPGFNLPTTELTTISQEKDRFIFGKRNADGTYNLYNVKYSLIRDLILAEVPETPDEFLSASYTLDSDELGDISGTPVEIIEAPGAGKAIKVFEAYAKNNHGDDDYDIGTDRLQLVYTSLGTGVWEWPNTFVNASTSQMNSGTRANDEAIAENKGLSITSDGDAADGDGTITITIFYKVVDF